MIIYKSSKTNLFTPIFLSIIFLLLSAAPINNFLTFRATNTDTFNAIILKPTPRPLAAIPKQSPEEEIAVPKLGSITTFQPAQTTTQTPANTNASLCPSHATAPAGTIAICGRVIPLQLSGANIGGATPPAGLAVQHTFYNIIYGHNSYDVFGDLYSLLQPGDQFTVNPTGVATTYTVFAVYNINTNAEFQNAAGAYRYGNPTSPIAIITCAPGVTYNPTTNATSTQDRTLILAMP